jgi:hypothetical protein
VAEELVTQVRYPIADLETMSRKKYGLKETLSDFRLEGDVLVLYFSSTSVPAANKGTGPAPVRKPADRPRRSVGRRNRMKTRGWKVVTRFVNSKGQQCSIYAPFVDALADKKLTDKERRSVVREILKSNGNKPPESSIEYYLSNTMEYLQKGRTGGGQS